MGNAIKISITLDYENNAADQSLAAGKTWALQAGQPLTGSVQFQVKKRMKQGGGQLKLFASGTERTQTRHKQKVVTNERNLLQVVANLSDMTNQIVKPGNYSYPFSIDIDSSLPSTMSWGETKHGCRIQYKISAGMGKFTAERSFILASIPIPDAKVPCFIEPKSESIKSMGLLKVPGSVTFGASVNDTHVGRNNEIDVSIACINNTTIDIRSVEIKLVELITFSSKETSFDQKLTLLEMKKVEMPGLMTAKTTRASVVKNEQSPEEVLMSTNHQIYEALTSAENFIRIGIPGRARDTYAGGIIKIQHYLKIKMITGPFAENPSTKIPLYIGNSALPLSSPVAQVARPEQPQPQVIPFVPAAIEEAPVQNEIPIVAALPMPMAPPSTIEPTVIHAHAVVLGGTPVQSERDAPTADAYDISDGFDFDNLVLLAAPEPTPPSYDRLVQDMAASVNDYDMIAQRLALQEWKAIFENLQPAEYGNVVQHISNDFDQPRIAVMVAEGIQQFTCSHCIAALKSTADWNRTTVVVKLIPFCTDLRHEKDRMLAELSPWEQTVTASDFEQALNK